MVVELGSFWTQIGVAVLVSIGFVVGYIAGVQQCLKSIDKHTKLYVKR